MASLFTWEGMQEFKAALKRMPLEMRNEAAEIMGDAAEQAADDARMDYPEYTGKLADSVKVVPTPNAGSFGVDITVINTAPHAQIFESGTTTPRRWRSGKNVGIMPPGKVFIPAMRRNRRKAYVLVGRMMQAQGLIVTDDGGQQ